MIGFGITKCVHFGAFIGRVFVVLSLILMIRWDSALRVPPAVTQVEGLLTAAVSVIFWLIFNGEYDIFNMFFAKCFA